MGKANTEAAVKAAAEAHRAAKREREAQGIFPGVSIRLTLTDKAYDIVKDMKSSQFRDFVSRAVRNASAKAKVA